MGEARVQDMMLLTPPALIVKVLTDINGQLPMRETPKSQWEYGHSPFALHGQSRHMPGWRTYASTGRPKCEAVINGLDACATFAA